jgi:hypothetical protein
MLRLCVARSIGFLPNWGADLYPLVIVGGLLIGVGALILLAGRRPSETDRRDSDGAETKKL